MLKMSFKYLGTHEKIIERFDEVIAERLSSFDNE